MSHFLNKLLYKSQYPDMTSALAGIITPAKGGHRAKGLLRQEVHSTLLQK
jgi:hypothetical protein